MKGLLEFPVQLSVSSFRLWRKIAIKIYNSFRDDLNMVGPQSVQQVIDYDKIQMLVMKKSRRTKNSTIDITVPGQFQGKIIRLWRLKFDNVQYIVIEFLIYSVHFETVRSKESATSFPANSHIIKASSCYNYNKRFDISHRVLIDTIITRSNWVFDTSDTGTLDSPNNRLTIDLLTILL